MFSRLPPVTKALLIVNVLVFLLQNVMPGWVVQPLELWPMAVGGLDYGPMRGFMPWQLLTYGFLHADPMHLLFNMLAVAMFGASLEFTWGPRRFLTYYLVCVVGAGLCQLVVSTWMVASSAMLYPTIGASGGVFGLLFAYGMLFPQRRVMLLIPPIPMRARTLVIVYGVLELLLGFTGLQPGVAHFAHLGGMLFGWLIILYWRRPRNPRPPSPPPRKDRSTHLRVVK